jgi:hypothetical protein
MKVIIAALAAAWAIAATTAPASAGPSGEVAQGYQGYQAYEVKTQYVQKKRYKKRRLHYQQQYWADKLPYGSQAWWQQMDREGRGGRRR